MQAFLCAAAKLLIVDTGGVPERRDVLVFFFEHIIETEPLAKLNPDPAISFRFTRRIDHLVVPDDAAVVIGARNTALLDTGCHGQHIIGERRSFVFEQVDMNDQI